MSWKKRIVIGGLPRSGSTLLRWHLDAASEIIAPPETSFFQVQLCFNQERIERRSRRIDKALRLGQEEITKVILSSSNSIYAFDQLMSKYAEMRGVSASIWAEKTPWNCGSYQWLSYEKEDIWFISTIRDGRDVVTSEHWRENIQYHCGVQRYIDSMNLIYNFDHQNHIVIRYEDLVTDIEGTLKGVFSQIGISWCESLMENARKEDEYRNATSDRQPLLTTHPTTSRIGRWGELGNEQRVSEFMSNSRAVEWLNHSGYGE